MDDEKSSLTYGTGLPNTEVAEVLPLDIWRDLGSEMTGLCCDLCIAKPVKQHANKKGEVVSLCNTHDTTWRRVQRKHPALFSYPAHVITALLEECDK